MADEFIIEILLRARDEASRQIDALQGKVDALRASAAGGRSTQDLQRGLDDLGTSAGGSADEMARLRAENEQLRRVDPQHRAVLRDQAKAHNVVADAADTHTNAISDTTDATTRLIDEGRRGQSVFGEQKKSIDDLSTSYNKFNRAVRDGQISTTEARRGYQDFTRDFTRLSHAADSGSIAARDFGRAADDAGKKLKNIPMAQAGNDFERLVAKMSKFGEGLSPKIVSLSAELRGLRLVGIVGFIQQIDTAVVGLAGGLTSLASSALQAGAALGGALVSGIAQAVPVAAVLLAGVERIKRVLAAVQLSTQLGQQQAFDPTQQAALQAQTTQALAAAQNGLVDAYNNVVTAQQHVVESQQALTDARIAAIRNITDLTLAEQTAAEQATGAKLSLAQAENALQQVQQTGGSQLQLQQAQLAVQEAQTGVTAADTAVPRAQADAARARRRGVAGSSGVLSAVEAARQAQLAQTRAPQQVQAAQVALQLAQMKAASPSGSQTSMQGQLNYLLGQMTAPEKVLFDSLTKLESMLRSPGSPLRKLSDAIVSPFATAVQSITKLFSDPKFMGIFDRLATAVGKGFGQVLSPKGGKGIFEQMASEATKNAPIIANIISHIESLFMSVAKAAAPALHTLLGFIKDFTGDLANTEGSVAGQKRLTAEFSLWEKRLEHIMEFLHSFHMLLKAIGQDAAPSGDNAFTSLTKSMDSATKWVQSHGPEVKKFFKETTDVLGVLGGVLLNIGGTMIAVFQPSSVKALAQFLKEFLLPAVSDVATAVGWLMTGLLKFINSIGPLRVLVEGLAVAFVGMLVLNKVADAFLGTTKTVDALRLAPLKFKETGSISDMWQTFTNRLHSVRDAAGEAKTNIDDLGNSQKVAGDKAATMEGQEYGAVIGGIEPLGTESKVTAGEVAAVNDAEGANVTESVAFDAAAGGEATAVTGIGTAAKGALAKFAPFALAIAAYELASHGTQTSNAVDKALGLGGSTSLTHGESVAQVRAAIAKEGAPASSIDKIIAQMKAAGYISGGKYTGPSYTASGQAIPTGSAPAGGYGALVTGGTFAGHDQGLDFTGAGHVKALAPGVVTRSQNAGSGWPGGGLLVYQITSGRQKCGYVYVAESIRSNLQVGATVKQGQTLGSYNSAYPGSESGFAQTASGQAYGNTQEGKGSNPPD